MRARYLATLCLLLLAGCASIMPQADTTAERIAAAYSTTSMISIIAANDLDAAVRRMQLVNDDLTRSAVDAELQRAKRVQRAVEATREVLVLADAAYVDGAVVEAGMYLEIVDQLLTELEGMQE